MYIQEASRGLKKIAIDDGLGSRFASFQEDRRPGRCILRQVNNKTFFTGLETKCESSGYVRGCARAASFSVQFLILDNNILDEEMPVM